MGYQYGRHRPDRLEDRRHSAPGRRLDKAAYERGVDRILCLAITPYARPQTAATTINAEIEGSGTTAGVPARRKFQLALPSDLNPAVVSFAWNAKKGLPRGTEPTFV